MNVNQAKLLITHLDKVYLKTDPLDKQLLFHFIPNLWKTGVVAKTSLQGRISCWIHRRDTKESTEAKIKKTFANALSTLIRENSSLAEVSLSLRVQLLNLSQSENLIDTSHFTHLENSAPELGYLEPLKEMKEDALKKEYKRQSLLRNLSPNLTPIDKAAFKKLFSNPLDYSKHSLTEIKEFLQTHPNFAQQNLEETMQTIENGWEKSKTLNEEFTSIRLNSAARQVAYREEAAKIHQQVMDLSTSAKIMFCGECGRKVNSIEGLLKFIKKLPKDSLDEVFKAFPFEIRNFFEEDAELPKPSQFIEKQLHTVFEGLRSECPDLKPIFESPLLKSLLSDNSRHVSKTLEKHLPKFAKDNFDSWLQQGLVGNILEFVPDSKQRDFFLWITEKCRDISTEQGRLSLVNEIEKKLIDLINGTIETGLNGVNESIDDYLEIIQEVIPSSFQQMIGLNFSNTPLWFQFEKEATGKYTVLIYSSGQGLKFHEHRSSNNTTLWPLKLCDIDETQLNVEFFNRLLFHLYEPQYNPKFEVDLKDIYEGLIPYLQGTVDHSTPTNWRDIPDNLTPIRMAGAILTKPSISPNRMLFEIRLEAFQRFCLPHMQGNPANLVVESMETALEIQHAIDLLVETANKLHPPIEKERLVSLGATQQEVKEIISQKKQQLEAEQDQQKKQHLIFTPTVLQAIGSLISIPQLISAKESLIWAIGDEVGELIDAIVVGLKTLPKTIPQQTQTDSSVSENEQNRSINKPKGWLRTILFSTYFKIALQSIKLAMYFTRLYRIGYVLWIKTAAQTGLNYTIDHFIPTHLRDRYLEFLRWYHDVMTEIRYKILESCLGTILPHITGQEGLRAINKEMKNWQLLTQNFIRELRGHSTLNYKLSEKNHADPNFSIKIPKVIIDQKIETTNLKDAINTTKINFSFDFKKIREPLQAINFIKKICAMNGQGSKNPQVFYYIFKNLESLEIPSSNVEGLWDQFTVEQAKECLESLSDIALNFYNVKSCFIFKNNPHQHARYIAAMFSVLAVMDKLARKCPESYLEGYKLNSYLLLQWIKKEFYYIEDPSLIECLGKICAYFHPDLDMMNLPDIEELQKKAKDTLFDYSFCNMGEANGNYYVSCANLIHKNVPEIGYLKRVLEEVKQDPSKRALLSQLCHHHLPKEHQLFGLLFEESLVFNRDTVLPRSYRLLRLQTLLCNESIIQGDDQNPINENIKTKEYFKEQNNDDSQTPQAYRLVKKVFYQIPLQFAGYWYARIPHFFQSTFSSQNLKYWHYFAYNHSYMVHGERREGAQQKYHRTQSEIVATPQRILSFDAEKNVHSAFEMIYTEKTDYIIRALGFFDNKKHLTNFDLLLQFKSTLFNGNKLSTQLKSYPKIVNTISAFLDENLDFLAAQKEYPAFIFLADLSIKLKKYCLHYTSEPHVEFPNIRKKTLDILNNPAAAIYHTHLLIILASECGKPTDDLERSVQFEACLNITQAFFESKDLNAVTPPTFSKQLRTALDVQYWEWTLTIENILKDQEKGSLFVQELLSRLKIQKPKRNTLHKEDRGSYCNYTYGSLKIDFTTGDVYGNNFSYSNRTTNSVEQVLSRQGIKTGELEFIDDALMISKDHRFHIHVKNENDYSDFDVQLHLNNKKYTLLNSKPIQYWLEISQEEEKELLMIDSKNEKTNYLVRIIDNDNYQILRKQSGNNNSYEKISTTTISALLKPLERFCDRNEIECWKKSDQNYIHEIIIKPFNLIFNVKEFDGELRALSQSKFPGYFLASNQNHPLLNDFSTYLLLENEQGQKKVLIPQNEWKLSAIWKFISQLGSLSTLINPWLSSLRSQSVQRDYDAFDLDENGLLTSEDTTALSHMIGYYLIQGKTHLAEALCTLLEGEARRHSLSEKIVPMLFPLSLVPPQVSHVSQIRQRLYAAYEENTLLYPKKVDTKPKKQEKTPTKNQFYFKNLIVTVSLFLDLQQANKEKDPRYTLRDDQEWLLFNALLRHSLDLFNVNATDMMKSVVEKIGWDQCIESLAFSPAMARRYRSLKNTFGPKDSLLEKALHYSSEVIRTPSQIRTPNMTSLVQQFNTQTPISPFPHFEVGDDCHFFIQQLIPTTRKNTRLKIADLILIKSMILWEFNPQLPLSIDKINEFRLIQDFYSYYVIAREYIDTPEKLQLKNTLLVLKGGWTPLTRRLCEYLDVVCRHPSFFPPIKAFEEALANPGEIKELPSDELIIKKYNKRSYSKADLIEIDKLKHSSLFSDFFYTLDTKVSNVNFYDHCQSLITKQGLNMIFSAINTQSINRLFSLLPGVGDLAGGGLTFPMLRWGSKVVQTIQRNMTSDSTAASSSIAVPVNSYAHLQEEDSQFDLFFDDLFTTAFEDVAVPEAIKSKQIKNFNSAQKNEFKKLLDLDESLQDYYQRKDRLSAYVKLHNEELLWTLYLKASSCYEKFSKSLDSELKDLLKLVNEGSSHLRKKLSFDDLKHFFIKGNFNDLRESIILPIEVYAQLEIAIARYIVKYTRFQQIKRILNHLEELSKISLHNSPHQFNQKTEELITALKARRAYQFTDTPVRLLRRFMLFEFSNNTLLWSKQDSRIKDWLLSSEDNLVIELLPSLGKSWCCIPTADSYEADGTKLIVNIWTSSLIGANVRQISKQSKRTFHQDTNVLTFSRETPLSTESFRAVQNVMQRALKHGETINKTKEDAQALELIFLDRLYQYSHSKTIPSNETLATLVTPKTILSTIRQKAKAIVDEVHEVFNDAQELNYPIGPRSTITPQRYAIIEHCFSLFLEVPEVAQAIQNNDLSSINLEIVVPLIAKKFIETNHFDINDKVKQNDFVMFASGRSSVVPEWIKIGPLYESISMVKGVLTVLLPLVIDGEERAVNVNFGRSLEKNHEEFARPYEANTSPLERASIRNPYEALIKTMIMMSHEGLNPKQVIKLVEGLYEKALKEMMVRNVTFSETTVSKKFALIHSEHTLEKVMELMSTSANEVRIPILETIQKSPKAILTYIQMYVYEQIFYWKFNLRSDAQNFASMFKSQLYDTGTPYNEGCYPSKSKMLWDPGTIGEAIHILAQKCPEDGIHLLRSCKGEEILDEVLHSFFRSGSGFTALVDGRAQLKGLTNEFVAQTMMEFVKKYRPDIKAIDYFSKDDSGKDQQVTLLVDATSAIPYDQCHLPLHEKLSYFDERHGFGANIPQNYNGKGLLLVGSNHALYRLLQEVFRMRGVKVFKKFLGIGEKALTIDELEKSNLSQTQTVHFALTPSVCQAVKDNRSLLHRHQSSTAPISLEDLVEFTAVNEDKFLRPHNYHSYCQKVKNVIRRAILDKILQAKTLEESLAIFKEFENVLVSRVEDDPCKLYGLIDTVVPIDIVLKSVRQNALSLIQESTFFNKDEIEDVQKEINDIPITEMPKEVHVFTDGKNLHLDLNEDLEKEVNQEQEADQELETDLQQEVEQQQVVHNPIKNPLFKEREWSDELNVYSLDWLNFIHPLEQTYFPRSFGKLLSKFSKALLLPPLFRVQDLLREAEVESLKKVSEFFDPRLWLSNNFLPRILSEGVQAPADICSKEQRELFEVLVHWDSHSEKIIAMGCLSQKEAAFWRRKLKGQESPHESKINVFIYDIVLRTIVEGGKNIDNAELRKSKDFALLEIQLKFLNGDALYPSDQFQLMKNWLHSTNHSKMKSAFISIFRERKKRDFCGTDMESLLES